MRALILALCLLATPALAADPVYRIAVTREDPGGNVFDYLAKYRNWYHQEATVRVEGECDSACTLVLGMMPLDRICATANAEFGFHAAARDGHYAKAMTELMWEMYPARVIRLLTPLGLGVAKPQFRLVYIDAQKIVQPCGPLRVDANAEPENGGR